MEKIIFKSEKIFFFTMVITTFLLIKFLPSIFPIYLPDSHDFLKIENSNSRTILYPLILSLCERLKINIFNFQILIMSLSISFLIYSLKKNNIRIFFLFIFWLSITCNIYYTSFTKTILPESLLFSAINFVIGIIFLQRKENDYIKLFFFIMLICFIAVVKKIGFVLSILLILFLFIERYSTKLIFFSFILLILTLFVENHIFFKFHAERDSVLPNAAMGKLFIISGKKKFDINNYKILESFHKEMQTVSNGSSEINKFISNIKDPFTRAEISSDYEVVLQYQNVFEIKNYNELKKKIFNNYKLIYFEILKNNFVDYLSISTNNFLGMWAGGSKFQSSFLNKVKKNEVPYIDFLNNSSSELNLPNSFFIKSASLLFKFFFLIFIVLTIFSVINCFKKKNIDKVSFLIFLCNIYLIIVSILNVSTLRYLMPIYPLILTALIFRINLKNLK